MKQYAFLICLFISFAAFSQTPPAIQWQKCLGGTDEERLFSGVKTIDGGYVAVGTFLSENGDITCSWIAQKIWVVKLSSTGAIVWRTCLGGIGKQENPDIANTPDGGFIISGRSNSTSGVGANHGLYDAYVAKLNHDGVLQWHKLYGGTQDDGFNKVVVDPGGGYVFFGSTRSTNGDVPPSATPNDIWAVKMNDTGAIQWQRFYGGNGAEYFNSIRSTADGGYILTGSTTSNNGPLSNFHGLQDVWVVKMNASFDILWQRCYGGSRNEVGGDIHETADGEYILCANTNSSDGDIWALHGPFENDLWMVKLNSDGTIKWSKTYGGIKGDGGNSMLIAPDGGYIVAGGTSSTDGDITNTFGGVSGDAWLIKINESRGVDWSRSYGGTRGDGFTKMLFANDGELILFGMTSSLDGQVSGYHPSPSPYQWTDFWIVKTGAVNTIKGKVFYDYNSNGVYDGVDKYAQNLLVKSQKPGLNRQSMTMNGAFLNNVDTGTITTTVVLPNAYFTAVPSSKESTFSTFSNTDSFNFALQPVPGNVDFKVNLLQLSPMRPGFFIDYRIEVTNAGTQALINKDVVLVKEKMTLVSASPVQNSISGDTIKWTITSLNPGQSTSIFIRLQISPPPTVNNGDVIVMKAAIDSTGDVVPANNLSRITAIAGGSFDPNDKRENSGDYISPQEVLAAKGLLYTIRFQNTGTDTAFNIVIRDTLDTKLNWNSVEMIASSHPVQVNINNGKEIAWTFSNIQLPDSNVNEPASHGYVSYLIRPKTTLPVGDTIRNTASIYFDFNLPVRTNTQLTIVRPNLPPPSPQVSGLLAGYCSNLGVQKAKIANLPAAGDGITVAVTLDASILPVAADSSFSFNVSTLSAGVHTLQVVFANSVAADTLRMNVTVIPAVTPDVNVAASTTTAVNLIDPVVVTASNAAGGGANPLYTFGKDRNFAALWQAEGSNNVLNILPTALQGGDNWVYVRMKTSSTCYTSQFNVDSIKISMQLPAPNQPVINGLAASYCNNQGLQKAKLGNYPAQGLGMTTTVKLDGNALTLASDTSFSFDVNTLVAGNHAVEVTYTNSTGTKTTLANFTVTLAASPDVNLTSNAGSAGGNEPVIFTASNVTGGGTTPLYVFAKDRSFTNILQAESANNTFTLSPVAFTLGENKVYVRMKTSLTCYTQQTAIDSIVITRFGVSGLIDPDFPNQRISFNPNPFRSRLTIHGLSATKTYTVTLYSQQGRTMQTIRITNRSTTVLHVPGQTAGIYMISIYDETKKRLIGTTEVVKQ